MIILRIIAVLVGIALMVAGYFVRAEAADFQAKGKKTTGTVVRVLSATSPVSRFTERRVSDPDGVRLTKLEVSYDVGGSTLTFTSDASSSYRDYRRGQSIRIVYDREDPGSARVAGAQGSMRGLILMVVGIIVSLWGLFGGSKKPSLAGGL